MKNIIKIFLIFAIITSMASAVYYPYKSTFPLSADISMNNHKLTGLAAPTASNDAATKAYVDGVGGGADAGGLPFVTVGFDGSMDYVVDGIDDDVQIKAAINDLPATGGIIYLGPGTYDSNSRIDIFARDGNMPSKISIIGPGTGAATIDATGLSEAIRVDYGTVEQGYMDSFSFKDFSLISNTDDAGSIGINIINSTTDEWSQIEAVSISGFSKHIAFSGQGPWPIGAATGGYTISNCVIGKWGQIGREYGIYIERAISVDIRDCNIGGYEVAGIYVERCDSMHIEDNIIISVAGEEGIGGNDPAFGIQCIVPDSDQFGVDWHITGNAIECTYVAAIAITGTSNTIELMQIFISDNEIGGGYNNGIFVDGLACNSHGLHIYHNDFLGAWRKGNGRPILVKGFDDFSIVDNTIDVSQSDWPYYAIRVLDGSGGEVSGNVIYRGAYALVEGIEIGTSDTSVVGNVIHGTGSTGAGINLDTTSSYCTALGNICHVGVINSGTNNEVAHNI